MKKTLNPQKGNAPRWTNHRGVKEILMLKNNKVLGKNQAKKNGNGYGAGTWVDTKMILSHAFLSLGIRGSTPIVSHSSTKILLMLLAKRKFGAAPDRKGSKQPRTRTDGNRITLTYTEVESRVDKETGSPLISRKSITRGIDELLAKGFIEIVDPGGCYEQHKAVYGLTDDYLLWQTGHVIRTRERDVKRGYQGKQQAKTKNTADVNGRHPHGRQRPSPPIEDTGVSDRHPQNIKKQESINGTA